MTKRTTIDPEDYTLPAIDTKACDVPALHKKPEAYLYSAKELKFLDVYIRTLDKATASKESGLKITQLKKNKYMMNELLKLQRILQLKPRLQMAGANHMHLQDKFEDVFDDAVADKDMKTATGMASTLARMSEASMRASGEFKDSVESKGVQIQVNINMGEEAPLIDQSEVIDVTIED